MHIELPPDSYRPAPPAREIVERYGIAVVGCGNIARGAHLPAYRDFGYRLVAACDLVEEKAQQAADEYGIPFVTTNVNEVLDNPDADVIDLAVVPADRLPLVEKIAEAGKHILSQKPLAPTLEEAEQIVAVCEQAGIVLMVNQQARWAPYHRALKAVIDTGVLGHVFSVTHLHRQHQDGPGSPSVTFPDFTIIDNGIHYVDLARFFTGRTPSRVRAVTTRVPGQLARDPMVYSILCEYDPDDLMATLHFNNIASALHHSPYLWIVDGSEAVASVARHGPIRGGRVELTVASGSDRDVKQVFDIHGSWHPEAWGGSMGEMLTALAEGRQPETHGTDNLDSIRVTDAAVQSSKFGFTVDLNPPDVESDDA